MISNVSKRKKKKKVSFKFFKKMQNIQTHLKDLPGHTHLKRRAREETFVTTSSSATANFGKPNQKQATATSVFDASKARTIDEDEDADVVSETKQPSSKPPQNSATKKSTLDDIDDDDDIDVDVKNNDDNNDKKKNNNDDDEDEDDEDLEAQFEALKQQKNNNNNNNNSNQQQQQQQQNVHSTQNLAAVVSTRGYDDDVPFRFNHAPLKSSSGGSTVKQINSASNDTSKKEKLSEFTNDTLNNQSNQKFLKRFFR
jgi:hypothetical protein